MSEQTVAISQSKVSRVTPSVGTSSTGQTPTRGDYAEMMARYLGPAITRAFADRDVTEVYVNPQDGRVRFDTRSRGKVDSGARLPAQRVEMFLNAVAAHVGTTIGAERPRLEAELPHTQFGGSRLQGFIPPLAQGPCFTIRKPPALVYSLDDFVSQSVLTTPQRQVLGDAVRAHENILIIGGTNTGKTTFCNGVILEMTTLDPRERFVILEDTVELQCSAPDHLALRTAPGISLAQLVKSTLRTSPNRIVVGEVRDEAALDLLDAWATGHPGGCATLHAASAAGALLRLDRLAQRANVPSQRALIAEAVHLIVLLQGGNGEGASRRHVADLVRVRGLGADGRFILSH